MTLTKSEIVEALNNEIGLNKREAKELVDSLFDHIKDLLEDGQEVKLSGSVSYTHLTLPTTPYV